MVNQEKKAATGNNVKIDGAKDGKKPVGARGADALSQVSNNKESIATKKTAGTPETKSLTQTDKFKAVHAGVDVR